MSSTVHECPAQSCRVACITSVMASKAQLETPQRKSYTCKGKESSMGRGRVKLHGQIYSGISAASVYTPKPEVCLFS